MVDIITLTSLVVAVLASVLAAVTFWLFRRDLRSLKLMEKGLEASALVEEFGQRSKRLEKEIVDHKVKLEVMELRMRNRDALQPQQQFHSTVSRSPSARTSTNASQRPRSSAPAILSDPSEVRISSSTNQSLDRLTTIQQTPLGQSPPVENTESVQREPEVPAVHEFSKSEREALKIVMESGRASAREIQNKIQKTREHTARLMNSLYKEGLVERDASARPFVYAITQKGREKL